MCNLSIIVRYWNYWPFFNTSSVTMEDFEFIGNLKYHQGFCARDIRLSQVFQNVLYVILKISLPILFIFIF